MRGMRIENMTETTLLFVLRYMQTLDASLLRSAIKNKW